MSRPVRSQIRQNIVDLLQVMGSGYGYEVYKAYSAIFSKTTLRNVYYHLKKGVATGEFIAQRTEQVKGEYSWGSEAEKTYYAIGPNAKPSANLKVKKFFEKQQTHSDNAHSTGSSSENH